MSIEYEYEYEYSVWVWVWVIGNSGLEVVKLTSPSGLLSGRLINLPFRPSDIDHSAASHHWGRSGDVDDECKMRKNPAEGRNLWASEGRRRTKSARNLWTLRGPKNPKRLSAVHREIGWLRVTANLSLNQKIIDFSSKLNPIVYSEPTVVQSRRTFIKAKRQKLSSQNIAKDSFEGFAKKSLS